MSTDNGLMTRETSDRQNNSDKVGVILFFSNLMLYFIPIAETGTQVSIESRELRSLGKSMHCDYSSSGYSRQKATVITVRSPSINTTTVSGIIVSLTSDEIGFSGIRVRKKIASHAENEIKNGRNSLNFCDKCFIRRIVK